MYYKIGGIFGEFEWSNGDYLKQIRFFSVLVNIVFPN